MKVIPVGEFLLDTTADEAKRILDASGVKSLRVCDSPEERGIWVRVPDADYDKFKAEATRRQIKIIGEFSDELIWY